VHRASCITAGSSSRSPSSCCWSRPAFVPHRGVLIVPLEDEYHWSWATISFAVGVNILLYGLIGPFAAAVMDRFGARRTMTMALALTAAGVALSPMMRQSWQLVLLWGVVVGAGCGVIGSFLAAYIPARWFQGRSRTGHRRVDGIQRRRSARVFADDG
jgi:MFS family permease